MNPVVAQLPLPAPVASTRHASTTEPEGSRKLSVTFTGRLAEELPAQQVRRVRHQVRDGLAVVGFSAVASSAFAVFLMLLLRLVG